MCGYDAAVPDFFRAAALGGYGIHSSPAFGRLCAARLCRSPLPDDLVAEGMEPRRLDPARLHER